MRNNSDLAVAAAKSAGLVYVTDSTAGYTRKRCGRGFLYLNAAGKPVRDESALRRFRGLVIPPAWTHVWICAHESGHLQATGRDAAGRKQYRYHPDWARRRNENKFYRMTEFGLALPALRRRVSRDLSQPGLNRQKVIALVVSLLEKTMIRVGNDEYTKLHGSFGLTTLTRRHVSIDGATLLFRFKGKSGVVGQVELSDRRLAQLVKRCQELNGYELFQYRNGDGQLVDIGSADVNAYLADATGRDFTAKDFRTWSGTVLATRFLIAAGYDPSRNVRKHRAKEAVKFVATELGNTVAVCRKYYVHDLVLEAYERGNFFDILRCRRDRRAWQGLRREEKDAMKLISCADAPIRPRPRRS